MRLGATKTGATTTYNGLGDQLYDLGGARPTLDLNFASNESLVDSVTGKTLVTFTRASSATYVDGDGVIQTAGNNVARFDHDPVTGESLGLLMEESRENLVAHSEDFSDSSWTDNGDGLTVTTNQTTAPDGTQTADLLTANAGTGDKGKQDFIKTLAIDDVYTVSCFFKANTSNFVRLHWQGGGETSALAVDLRDGSVLVSANQDSYKVESLPNGWYKLSLTNTAISALGFAIRVHVCKSDGNLPGATGSIYAWGAQVEEGSFPTSYIRTSGSTATRAADFATISGTDFSSWYNQTESTVAISWHKPWSGNWVGYKYLFGVVEAANPTQNFITFGITNGGGNNQIYWSAKTSNVNQLNYKQYGASGPNSFKHAIAVASNDAAFSHAGAISNRTDTSITLPTVDKARIDKVNSHISRITYWPTRLSNDTLNRISV